MVRLSEANRDREIRELKKDGDPEPSNTQLFLPNRLALKIYNAISSTYRVISMGNITDKESV